MHKKEWNKHKILSKMENDFLRKINGFFKYLIPMQKLHI